MNKNIARMRKLVIAGAKDGGWEQRCRLAAYGFLKEKPYETIEQKTNEDKLDKIGRASFYTNFTYDIAQYVCQASEIKYTDEWATVKNWLDIRVSKLLEAA